MTPDACRSLQIGPHDSRCVQMPPHGSRWLQTSADRSVGSRLQIAPDCCRWLQMNQDASRCLQMAPDSSRWLETTPHDSNSSQMAPDGVKLNIWSCFHYCSQLANCKSANILTVHTCCGKACSFLTILRLVGKSLPHPVGVFWVLPNPPKCHIKPKIKNHVFS